MSSISPSKVTTPLCNRVTTIDLHLGLKVGNKIISEESWWRRIKDECNEENEQTHNSSFFLVACYDPKFKTQSKVFGPIIS